jgi:hypothetical protein
VTAGIHRPTVRAIGQEQGAVRRDDELLAGGSERFRPLVALRSAHDQRSAVVALIDQQDRLDAVENDPMVAAQKHAGQVGQVHDGGNAAGQRLIALRPDGVGLAGAAAAGKGLGEIHSPVVDGAFGPIPSQGGF